MKAKQHPAKFSDSILEIIKGEIEENDNVRILDPFGGTGKLNRVINPKNLYINELEVEWLVQGFPSNLINGNALYLPFEKECFDYIITSPVYGNRMSDHHNAKDGSRRNTYTHTLGRKLHPDNSGVMQWGDEYREFHKKAWKESVRVLKNNGIFILNVSNHIRKGKEVDVSSFHLETLIDLGLSLITGLIVWTPRYRMGENSELRVNHENIFILKRIK